MKNRIKKSAIISLLLLVYLLSCKKEYSCENCVAKTISPDTSLNDYTIFTDVVVDGTRYFNISGRDGCGAGSGAYGNTTTHAYYANVSGKAYSGNGTFDNSLYFYKGMQSIDSSLPLKPQTVAYFAPGSYAYKQINSITDGVVFTWTDNQGKEWRTDSGNANQAGSVFAINKEDFSLLNGDIHGIYIKATFSCTVYDDAGNFKKITNGRFCLLFWV